jgi:hypothetical protein
LQTAEAIYRFRITPWSGIRAFGTFDYQAFLFVRRFSYVILSKSSRGQRGRIRMSTGWFSTFGNQRPLNAAQHGA